MYWRQCSYYFLKAAAIASLSMVAVTPTQLVFRLLAIQVHTARASVMLGSKKKCAGVKSDIRSVSLRHYMVSAANQSPTTATFWERSLGTHLADFFERPKSSSRILCMVSYDTPGYAASVTFIFLHFGGDIGDAQCWEWQHFTSFHDFCLSSLQHPHPPSHLFYWSGFVFSGWPGLCRQQQ